MAFTGTIVVTQTKDNKVRITGAILAGAATGTVGLHGDTGADIQLPAAFKPEPSHYEGGGALALADIVEAREPIPMTDVTDAVPISITKGGTPFRVSYHNDSASTSSAILELWIERSN